MSPNWKGFRERTTRYAKANHCDPEKMIDLGYGTSPTKEEDKGSLKRKRKRGSLAFSKMKEKAQK